jgi:hypothetical protein
VLPPLWFLTEHKYIGPRLKLSGLSLEEFAHEQKLSRNLWPGIGAVIMILLVLTKV